MTAEYQDISTAPQQLLHVITATLAQHYAVDRAQRDWRHAAGVGTSGRP